MRDNLNYREWPLFTQEDIDKAIREERARRQSHLREYSRQQSMQEKEQPHYWTGQGPKPQPNEQSWQGEHPAIRQKEEYRIPAEVETLRDRFAMAALMGMGSYVGPEPHDGRLGKIEIMAEYCYRVAEAMMKERQT